MNHALIENDRQPPPVSSVSAARSGDWAAPAVPARPRPPGRVGDRFQGRGRVVPAVSVRPKEPIRHQPLHLAAHLHVEFHVGRHLHVEVVIAPLPAFVDQGGDLVERFRIQRPAQRDSLAALASSGWPQSGPRAARPGRTAPDRSRPCRWAGRWKMMGRWPGPWRRGCRQCPADPYPR